MVLSDATVDIIQTSCMFPDKSNILELPKRAHKSFNRQIFGGEP